MKNFLLLFFVIVMLGCSAGEISEIGLNTEKGENTARSLAENELSLLSDTDGTLWTKDSVVTELFPIYLEGKSLPSYYECKIETKGEDAGYILVNVDATDLPIVEASETGKTTTEIYREKYGTDISIIRYGLFYSTVIEGQPTAGRAVNRVLGTIGYEDEETIARLRSEILTKGVNPIYEKEELEELQKRALIVSRAAETRVISAEIKGETKKYTQHNLKPDGYPVGCGPTAWAIVYAYWKDYKGFNKLFNGKDPDALSRTAMEQIATYCKTTHWKKYGVTLPSRMDAGIEYAFKYGYKKSKVINENGTYYPKFADIEGSLRGDRPVIMGVNGDGIGAIDHYVVVVGARKQQEKVLGKWKDRGWITYRCNWGWGRKMDQWIYAKDNEGDGEYPRHSTYQIWKINLAE